MAAGEAGRYSTEECWRNLKLMRTVKLTLKYLLALFFIAAGVNHFIDPAFYLKIMPPYLPWHLSLVYLSGVCEMVLGAALLFQRTARLAAWGIIALLVAVFPANIHMALNHDLYPEYNPALLWARLPLQLVLMAWAYWHTRRDAPEPEWRATAADTVR